MPSHPLCNTAPAARWLGLALVLLSLGLLVMGVAVGSTGLEAVWRWPHDAIAQQIIVEIRLPRTLGAWLERLRKDCFATLWPIRTCWAVLPGRRWAERWPCCWPVVPRWACCGCRGWA